MFFLFTAGLVFFFACTDSVLYEANINIPNETWNADSLATFQVDVRDTSSVFNIYINLRNTTNYPNSNLFLFIQTTSPEGAMLRDTLELFLADSRGNWLGKGFGSIRDIRVPYKQHIRFPEVGSYHFNVQQGMRASNLKGIKSIGLRVEKNKTP